MNISDWRMLAALFSTQNITQAAQQLFLSQPTITARIKKLEDYYGIRILIRKHRGVTFTPEGEVLAHHAVEMLHAQRKLEEKLNNMKKQVNGTLRVGVSNFFTLNKMPKILRLFKEQFPNIECQVVSGWSSEMHRKLLTNDVHVSIVKGDFPWKDHKELLYDEELCIASPWEFRMEELPSMPRIDYHTDQNMHTLIEEWWYSHFEKPPYINIYVNHVETCKEMVINGLGYAILANLVVKPYPNLIIKTLFDSKGQPLTRKTWMYYHNESLQLNIVNAFVSFMKELNVKEL
ncbi:LysR family transcriptional regulator [Caldifermentibacillus hisashii]|uniref:LysR family transcriptional regulator n=1 Tax=Caldifermentibacillus hisashii TaxID=996558 RepID=UPI0031013E66